MSEDKKYTLKKIFKLSRKTLDKSNRAFALLDKYHGGLDYYELNYDDSTPINDLRMYLIEAMRKDDMIADEDLKYVDYKYLNSVMSDYDDLEDIKKYIDKELKKHENDFIEKDSKYDNTRFVLADDLKNIHKLSLYHPNGKEKFVWITSKEKDGPKDSTARYRDVGKTSDFDHPIYKITYNYGKGKTEYYKDI